MTRKTPLRQRRREGPDIEREVKPAARSEAKPAPAPKAKVCAYEKCGKSFLPQRPMQSLCSARCATRQAQERVKAREAEARADAKAHRDALARLPDLLAAAQQSFNRWVRARDAAQPCISCGAQPPEQGRIHAGRDAGHYRSVGSAGHLRFHEDNCHAQCVACNQWGAGKAVDYRIGLVRRIGLARVEALEAQNGVRKWTREEVCAIRDTYKAKLKALLAERKATA